MASNVIIESNSIGLGYYADNGGAPSYNAVGSPPFPDGWAAIAATSLGAGYAFTNNSIDSGSTQQLTSADSTAGYPLLDTTKDNIAFLFEVVNDYFHNSLTIAQCLTNVESWCSGWRTAASNVGASLRLIFGAPLPRDPGSPNTWDTDRRSIVTSVISAGIFDEVADFGGDPIMGAFSTLTNTTYYRPDFTHPLLAGHAILANIAAAAIQRCPRGWLAYLFTSQAAAIAAKNIVDAAVACPFAGIFEGSGLHVAQSTTTFGAIWQNAGGTLWAYPANATTTAALTGHVTLPSTGVVDMSATGNWNTATRIWG